MRERMAVIRVWIKPGRMVRNGKPAKRRGYWRRYAGILVRILK